MFSGVFGPAKLWIRTTFSVLSARLMEAKTPKMRGSERTADMKEWGETKSRRKSKGPGNKNRIGEDQVCESVSGSPLNKFNKPVSLRRSLDPDESFLSVSSSSLISYESCRHSRREVLLLKKTKPVCFYFALFMFNC